jgi:DNA-binding response OmpR family regulator
MATKIMLVEDDTNLSEIYQARLQAEGFDIISAADGEEALALAVNERPDLIICDVMMPRISGFDMLDILRGTAGIQDTKVIMMTALSQAEDKERAEKLGANRYLVKSQVTLEDVVKTVHEVLGDKPQDTTPEPVESPVKTTEKAEPEEELPKKDEADKATSEELTTEPPTPTSSTVIPDPVTPGPTDLPDDQTTKAEESTMQSQIQSFVDNNDQTDESNDNPVPESTEEPKPTSDSGHSMNKVIEPAVSPPQTDIQELVNAEDKKTIESAKRFDDITPEPEENATATEDPVKKTEPEIDPNQIAL